MALTFFGSIRYCIYLWPVGVPHRIFRPIDASLLLKRTEIPCRPGPVMQKYSRACKVMGHGSGRLSHFSFEIMIPVEPSAGGILWLHMFIDNFKVNPRVIFTTNAWRCEHVVPPGVMESHCNLCRG